jgi:hypothetical protein
MWSAIGLSGFAFLGVAIATAYAGALAWNASLYTSTGGARNAVLVHLGRSVLLSAGLVGLARCGVRPFTSALLAFACTHAAIVAVARRRA